MITVVRSKQLTWKKLKKNWRYNIGLGDFPGGPVVKTSPSTTGGAGSIPGQGTKIPHAL